MAETPVREAPTASRRKKRALTRAREEFPSPSTPMPRRLFSIGRSRAEEEGKMLSQSAEIRALKKGLVLAIARLGENNADRLKVLELETDLDVQRAAQIFVDKATDIARVLHEP